jgi:hypothetical protein
MLFANLKIFPIFAAKFKLVYGTVHGKYILALALAVGFIVSSLPYGL